MANEPMQRPILTPTQVLFLQYLHALGRGRMTKYVTYRYDPRTAACMRRDGWLRVDGDRMGLTEDGWQMMERRSYRVG